MWGHIIPVFYDADRQAWCGLRTEQREYPYSWAMSVIPIPYGRYLTAQPGFPRCGSRDYGYEMVSGPGQQGGDNEALTSGIPQGVMEKALLADDTGPLGNALVSSSPSAVAASIPASGDPSKQAEQDKAISKIKGIAREVDTAPDGSVISIDFRDTTVSDADLAVLEGFTRLQVLNLNETNITDAGLVHLKGLTRLESLYLRAPNVTDAGLEHLKGLTQLQRLNLDCTGVTNAGLMHLRGLTQLRYLGLGRSKVTDAGMGLLTGFTQLESLNLIGTEVTDAGLKQLQGLPRLRRLTRPDGNRTAAFQ
jgi:hypothetical protein